MRDELGWAPAIPLEQTLRDVLDDWRQRVRSNADRESVLRR
jgi:nucleoside-diphosphate-sugar epimerase